jgi:hypothetical protein
MLTATTGERDEDTKKLLNSILADMSDDPEGNIATRVNGIPEIMLEPINETTEMCDIFIDLLASSTSGLMEFVKDNNSIPKTNMASEDSSIQDASRKTNAVLSKLDMSECSTVQQYVQDMNDIDSNFTFVDANEQAVSMLRTETTDFLAQNGDKTESIQFLDSSLPLL